MEQNKMKMMDLFFCPFRCLLRYITQSCATLPLVAVCALIQQNCGGIMPSDRVEVLVTTDTELREMSNVSRGARGCLFS